MTKYYKVNIFFELLLVSLCVRLVLNSVIVLGCYLPAGGQPAQRSYKGAAAVMCCYVTFCLPLPLWRAHRYRLLSLSTYLALH
jgi:hypothetical protein